MHLAMEVTVPPPKKNFWRHNRFKKFGGITDSRKYAPKKFGGAIRVVAMHPKNIYSFQILLLSAIPPKDLALFCYIYPTKNLLMIKYELLTSCRYISKRVVHLLGSAKNWATHEPCYAPLPKILFINAVQCRYGCQQNVRKNITVTVSVSVNVMVRVSLVWFVSGNNLVVLCITIWWMKYITLSQISVHSRFTKLRPQNLRA